MEIVYFNLGLSQYQLSLLHKVLRRHTLSTPNSFKLLAIPSRTLCLDRLPGLSAGALVWIAKFLGASCWPRVASLPG